MPNDPTPSSQSETTPQTSTLLGADGRPINSEPLADESAEDGPIPVQIHELVLTSPSRDVNVLLEGCKRKVMAPIAMGPDGRPIMGETVVLGFAPETIITWLETTRALALRDELIARALEDRDQTIAALTARVEALENTNRTSA